jgi:hypothetical protein
MLEANEMKVLRKIITVLGCNINMKICLELHFIKVHFMGGGVALRGFIAVPVTVRW